MCAFEHSDFFYTVMHQGNCSKSGDTVKNYIIFGIIDNSQSSLY